MKENNEEKKSTLDVTSTSETNVPVKEKTGAMPDSNTVDPEDVKKMSDFLGEQGTLGEANRVTENVVKKTQDYSTMVDGVETFVHPDEIIPVELSKHKKRDPQEVEKKKVSPKIFIIIGVIVLLIGVLGAGGYFLYTKLFQITPIKVYENVINGSYDKFKESLNTVKEVKDNNKFDSAREAINYKINAKVNSSADLFSKLSDYGFSIELSSDLKNSKAAGNVSILKDNASILDVGLQVANNNTYLNTSLYDKPFDVGSLSDYNINMQDITTAINGDEIDKKIGQVDFVVETLKSILVESLDKGKLSMSSETITIGGVDYNVKNASYLLDNENMDRTIKFFQEKMLGNTKFLETIVELTNDGSKSKEEALDELKKEIGTEVDLKDYKPITVSLYIDSKNDLIAGKAVREKEEILDFQTVGDQIKAVARYGANTRVEIDARKDALGVKRFVDEQEDLSLTLTSKDAELNFAVTIKEDGEATSIVINLTDIKNVDGEFSCKFGMDVDGVIVDSRQSFGVNGDILIKVTDYAVEDPKESVKLSDLPETEQMKISNNVEDVSSKLGVSDLVDGYFRIYEIEDLTIGKTCATAMEEFYRDSQNIYYFGCIKKDSVLVHFNDGTTLNVSDALKQGRITIADLDKNNISYIAQPL